MTFARGIIMFFFSVNFSQNRQFFGYFSPQIHGFEFFLRSRIFLDAFSGFSTSSCDSKNEEPSRATQTLFFLISRPFGFDYYLFNHSLFLFFRFILHSLTKNPYFGNFLIETKIIMRLVNHITSILLKYQNKNLDQFLIGRNKSRHSFAK